MKNTIARAAAFSALVLAACASKAGQLYNFSDLGIGKDTHYDPSALVQTGKEDQGMIDIMGSSYGSGFYHAYNTYGGVNYGVLYNANPYMGTSWHGFAYSSMTDTSTAGSKNQYSAITGSGYGGSDNYLVFYGDGVGMGYNKYSEDGLATIGITSPDAAIEGMWITNTTYSYFSMLNGDGWNTKFEEGDYFKLIISGYDISGENEIGSTSIMLGNGTDLLDDWAYVDILNEIGAGVELVSFGFEQYTASTGKTVTNHGCKAPTYFAVGGMVTAVPEPGTCAAAFGIAAFTAIYFRRRAA